MSLLFHGKAISLSFVECVRNLANSGGRYISIYISDFRCTIAPSPAIYGITVRSRWPQGYANGSFVSYNKIFTILFFNTFYHKQINRTLIAAFIETFRQSLDPVYAHTSWRAPYFQPKVKDFARRSQKSINIAFYSNFKFDRHRFSGTSTRWSATICVPVNWLARKIRGHNLTTAFSNTFS